MWFNRESADESLEFGGYPIFRQIQFDVSMAYFFHVKPQTPTDCQETPQIVGKQSPIYCHNIAISVYSMLLAKFHSVLQYFHMKPG